MKINFKVRAKNPQFWIQIALSIAAPVFAYYGITGADLTTWGSVGKLAIDALSNPYVLATAGVSVYNALNDPTTRGLSDSRQAMSYNLPKKDVRR
ncbi:phage holin family protein [Lysinibacillus sp. NPDC093712]|uniref:phage holin family protein n=1 Tax=Lysinibacillus sp. NPDC093712 TaxID=3390579 RepID=UPI003D0104E4